MNLTRYQRPNLWPSSVFDHLTNLRQEIDRFFDAPMERLNADYEFLNGWAPSVDLYEDKDNLIVTADLPGMKKEEIEISLHNDTLAIAGERKFENQKEQSEFSRSERFFGRFQRTFELPKPVEPDRVKAQYKDGILTITLPKTEESKPKQIQVKTS